MSKACLAVMVQGTQGRTFKNLKQQGQISLAIDYNGTDDRQLWVDAFQGTGTDYKRRDKSLINIYNYKGIPVFSGTFDEMCELIEAGRRAK